MRVGLLAGLTAVLLVLGLGAGGVLPADATPPPVARHAAKASPEPTAVVGGIGTMLRGGDHPDGTVVVDGRGRTHAIAVTSTGFHRVHLRYEVTGAGGRVRSSQSRRFPIAGPSSVTSFLSRNGRKLIVVVAGCKDIWTSRTGIDARHLHPLELAIKNVEHCGGGWAEPHVYGAAAIEGGRIALLASAGTPHVENGTPEPFGLWTGVPGQRLSLDAQQPPIAHAGSDVNNHPDTTALRYLLAGDPDTGRLVAVGLQDATPTGATVGNGLENVVVTVRGTDGSWWGAPTVLADVGNSYEQLDVTARQGQIAVALSGSHYTAAVGAILIEGTESGVWEPPAALSAVVRARNFDVRVAYGPTGDLGVSAIQCKKADAKVARIRTYYRDSAGWLGTPGGSAWSPVQIDELTSGRRGWPLVAYSTVRPQAFQGCS